MGAGHPRALIEEGRTVVLITSHIQSTEVGAGQMPARLVHRMATSDDPKIREILDEVILVLIPSLNPDGTQMVSNWWRDHRGTAFESAPLPRLYHHYIGPNNNRDWYFFAQQETRLTVEGAHNTWRP
jgi:murein tripeptide amidase MpaA